MVSRKEGKKVLWPSYFNSHLKRSGGRRVPKDLAVENPKLPEIFMAVKSMGLEYEVDYDARYPSHWWREEGRVLVRTDMKKENLLKKVAEIIKNNRKEEN